jgi:hypothetical protein
MFHKAPSSASAPEPAQAVWGHMNWSLLLLTLGLTAVLQVVVAGRSGLWADEVFSLALATGHSLEHAAAVADPRHGDFVEPNHPVPAAEFSRYLKHESPPANPARVVRAVLLSDTNPPLYYLLLYGWTIVLGTSDIALRLFSIVCALACLPLLAAIARRTGADVFSSCVLFAFSPLGIYYSTEGRMYSLLWLCVLATTWASLILQQRSEGIAIYTVWIAASVAGFLTHYFFVFPWLANCCISLDCARETHEAKTGGVSIADRYFNSPVVYKNPGEPCRLANYKGLAERATAGILSLDCIT